MVGCQDTGKQWRLGRQDGGVMLEFAFVFPIFLLFMLGMLDGGLAIYQKHVLTNASRAGARAASLWVSGRTPASAETAGFNACNAYVQTWLTGATCTSIVQQTAPPMPTLTGQRVTVTVTYERPSVWVKFLGSGASLELTGATTMIME